MVGIAVFFQDFGDSRGVKQERHNVPHSASFNSTAIQKHFFLGFLHDQLSLPFLSGVTFIISI